jgi:hypothetical protein
MTEGPAPKWISKQQVIEEVIIPAIEANGAWVAGRDEFDLERVFNQCFAYSASLGGFFQAVGDAEFWDAVENAAYGEEVEG